MGLVAAMFLSVTCVSAEPPGILNPVSRTIEHVYAADGDVFWVEDLPGSSPQQLTRSQVGDNEPKLCINDETGDTYVMWWRAGSIPSVLVRIRSHATEEWSDEITLSAPNEEARSPACGFSNGRLFFGYEATNETGMNSILVGGGDTDCPNSDPQCNGCPGPNCIALSFAQKKRPLPWRLHFHTEEEKLWADWIQSPGFLAWREYRQGKWTEIHFVTIEGDDVVAAREDARKMVLSGEY